VNEEYTDKNMVLLVMPKDEDHDAMKINSENLTNGKGDPVYEVKVGKVRCADYCGGLFEGDLELRIARGYPEYNMSTGVVSGKFSTVIPITYERSYAKAAVKDWTVYSYAGWKSVFIPWDTNWRKEKVQQIILVYEYDKAKDVSVSASVGYKTDTLSSTISSTVKTTYSGEFLGINEWDRDWFLETLTSPESGDVVKDGLTARKTCDVFLLTTPLRTIN